MEGEAPSSETTTSLDSPSAYHQGPLVSASSLSPDHYEHASVGAYGLYSGPPGQQRARRPKLQHSTSILRKQAEEDAIKRSRSLSESYELSSDLQDKQVGGARWRAGVGQTSPTWVSSLLGNEGVAQLSPSSQSVTGRVYILDICPLCPWRALTPGGSSWDI